MRKKVTTAKAALVIITRDGMKIMISLPQLWWFVEACKVERFTKRNNNGQAVCHAETRNSLVRCTEIAGGEPIEYLAKFEDKIESKLLLELPCKVGDTAYIIHYSSLANSTIGEIIIGGFIITHSMEIWVQDKCGYAYPEYFVTKEEAKVHLKRLQTR